MLLQVNDPRHPSYTTYDTDVLLVVTNMKNLFNRDSMLAMAESFNRDEYIENLKKVLNKESLEELPYYDTINDFLSVLDQFFSDSILAEALVQNRCINPLSKINVMDWMNSTVLPSLYDDTGTPDNYAIYRELDDFNRRETELQTHIYNQLDKFDHSIDEAMFYDITSTYMEGVRCVISKFGHSRDHRQDREQVVIALLVTP